jgi:hypothetical protein
LLLACKRETPSPPPPPAEPPRPAIALIDASPPAPASEVVDAGPVERHARKAKSIGHTSVVFKVETLDGKKIVWKPDSRVGRGRYRGEIAAYRLATLLGIDNVPRAEPLDFMKEELELATKNDEKAKELFETQIVFDGNVAHGMFTEWIDDYAVLPLENDKSWKGWLKKDGVIPDDKKDLAAAISTMIVFDYITGNWDRWSGANIATSKGKVLYVDNDAAFFFPLPKDGEERNKRLLEGVDRFSKRFVEKLRQVDDIEISHTLDVFSSIPVRLGVLARRREAVAAIEKKELFFD